MTNWRSIRNKLETAMLETEVGWGDGTERDANRRLAFFVRDHLRRSIDTIDECLAKQEADKSGVHA